jgi:hypothetical protein
VDGFQAVLYNLIEVHVEPVFVCSMLL